MFVVFSRTFFLYLLVIFCLRFMGKRQIGELQPSELVTTIIISNIAAIPIENIGSPLINAALPILIIACTEVILSSAGLKFLKFRQLVSGLPIMIIRNGVIDQKALRTIRFSIDDLMEQLRSAGHFDITKIGYAIVETNGKISIYEKFESRTATCGDLNITPPPIDCPPVIIIKDGSLDPNALDFCGLTEDWLHKTLKKEGNQLKDIFIMSCDCSKNYNIILKEQL